MNSFSVIQGGKCFGDGERAPFSFAMMLHIMIKSLPWSPGPGDGSKDFNYCRTSSQHPGLPSKGSTGSSASNFPLHLEDLG